MDGAGGESSPPIAMDIAKKGSMGLRSFLGARILIHAV